MRIHLAALASLAISFPVAASPTPPPTIDRLDDAAGPIPGASTFAIERHADPHVCGGVALTFVRIAPPAGDGEALAPMLELAAPTGLDFTPAHAAASLARFNSWVDESKRLGGEARKHYDGELKVGDLTAKIQTTTRIVQLARLFASRLARIEIPIDVRTGADAASKSAAFCERMASVSLPLLDMANVAARECAKHAGAIAPGWWTPVCVER